MTLNDAWSELFMEILIERKDVHYLQNKFYKKAEVIQQDQEIRIYLYTNEPKPLVFLLVEPAREGELLQIEQWLVRHD